MIKNSGWVPIDKMLAQDFKYIKRPFSRIEAMFSYTVDVDNGIEGTIAGYAAQWGWSRNKVRKFLNDIKTGKGHLKDRRRTEEGHPIRFIDNGFNTKKDRRGTEDEKDDCIRTEEGQKRDRRGTEEGHPISPIDNGFDTKKDRRGTEEGQKRDRRGTELIRLDTKTKNSNICSEEHMFVDENEISSTSEVKRCQNKKIIGAYNEILGDVLPQCKMTTTTFDKMLRSRWREDKDRQNMDWWIKYFNFIRESDFLMGRTNTEFMASFEWIIRPTNMAKIINGNYHRRGKKEESIEEFAKRLGYE